jgi:hypothetical protein
MLLSPCTVDTSADHEPDPHRRSVAAHHFA